MSEHNYGELASIQTAFDTLREYNQFLLFSLDDKTLDIPELKEYFESPLDDPIEKRVESIVSAAAVRMIYSNPNIPQKNKQKVAIQTARDSRQALQIAKVEYHAQTKNLSVREYERRKAAIPLIRRAMMCRNAIRKGVKTSVNILIHYVFGPVGIAVKQGAMFAWSVIPQPVRDTIKRTATEVVEKATTIIGNCVEAIRHTAVGRKVEQVVQKVAPIISRGVEKVKKKTRAFVDRMKSYIPNFI